MVRIVEVQQIGGFEVRLKLSDGRTVDRDLKPLLQGRVFEAVKTNPEVFRSVTVVDGTLVWPNGVDLCPDMIIWGGGPPANEALQVS